MRLLILGLFIVVSFLSFGQETILEKFQARLLNGEVVLNWTIMKGSTCNGIDLTKSIDGYNFNKIGRINGICGSANEAVPYTLDDKQPAFTINYYRLELGGVGSSKIITMQVINLGEDGYLVQPNPFVSSTKIYFQNERNEPYNLALYDVNGNIISEKTSNTNFFSIGETIHTGGIYVFVITNEKGEFNAKGKLLRVK